MNKINLVNLLYSKPAIIKFNISNLDINAKTKQ